MEGEGMNVSNSIIYGVGRSIYRRSCPNCSGSISESRLNLGLPCERCLPSIPEGISSEKIYSELEKHGTPKKLKEIWMLEGEAEKLISLFEKALGYPPWGAQKSWIKRFVRGDSFTIIAPTGVGKTTFGIIASLYMACDKKEKSYIIVPTTTLVIQVEGKARDIASRIECNPRIVAVHGKMRKNEKEKALEAIEKGEYDILISTVAFARKYVESLSKAGSKLLFVDDVDAILKSGKSVDTILRIAGFTSEHLEVGLKVLNLQREIARLRAVENGDGSRRKRIEELHSELEVYQAKLRSVRGVARLIVSSATGRPRGSKVRLFKVLLGFEAGGRGDIGLRNVVDSYVIPSNSVEDTVVDIVKKLGSGTLVYIPLDSGIEGAERLAERLRSAGIRARAYHAKTTFKVLHDFIEGELDVLVGVANYYGALVRGLDLPERVKYAVFAGIPRHRFSADVGEPHPGRLARILSLLSEVRVPDISEGARRYLAEMRRMLRRFTPAYIQFLVENVLEGDIESGGRSARVLAEAYKFVMQALADPDVWRELEARSDVCIVSENGVKYILVADTATYLQASGRTSRLYAGGITKGLSIVVVDHVNLFKDLEVRSKAVADIKWSKLEEMPLDSLIAEIERDREKVSNMLKGETVLGELVKSALLVVESPNKARTIASFFGRPSVRIFPGGLRVYEVSIHNLVLTIAASGGHVFELVTRALESDIPESVKGSVEGDIFGAISIKASGKRVFTPIFSSIKRCTNCGHQFTDDRSSCPRCGSVRIRDSMSIIEDLRRAAWEADMVLIGTDPDREGEKIAWDLALLLRPYNRSIYRLEFHEVTRSAILRALRETLEERKGVRERLVEAQLVRRIEDRWIGFTLSPLLWCIFWPLYCDEMKELGVVGEAERCSERYNFNLSAGRVQTPALGWVVNRYEESRKRVNVYTLYHDNVFLVTFRDEEVNGELRKYLKESARKGDSIEVMVREVSREIVKVSPPPPYTTDTMIADAGRLLGMGAPETMRIAQDLFEWGLITYHRTDSTRVSERGLEIALDYLRSRFGGLAGDLFKPRRWGEGGAHEAIRPVRSLDAKMLQALVEEGVLELPGRLTQRHLRLYDMIFRRFIASQMREAEAVKVNYEIDLIGYKLNHTRIVEVGLGGNDVSKGFTLLWEGVRVGGPLKHGFYSMRVKVSKVRAKPPYTQGELVEEMKARGIGRPSTYAKIVETLIKRGYIIPLKGRRGYIVASRRGRYVYRFLSKDLANASEELYGSLASKLVKIPELISEERTKNLEKVMDEIEGGERNWVDVVNEIYREIEELSLPIRLLMLSREVAQLELPEEFRRCLEKARLVFGGEV